MMRKFARVARIKISMSNAKPVDLHCEKSSRATDPAKHLKPACVSVKLAGRAVKIRANFVKALLASFREKVRGDRIFEAGKLREAIAMSTSPE